MGQNIRLPHQSVDNSIYSQHLTSHHYIEGRSRDNQASKDSCVYSRIQASLVVALTVNMSLNALKYSWKGANTETAHVWQFDGRKWVNSESVSHFWGACGLEIGQQPAAFGSCRTGSRSTVKIHHVFRSKRTVLSLDASVRQPPTKVCRPKTGVVVASWLLNVPAIQH